MIPFRKKRLYQISNKEYQKRIELQSRKTLIELATNRIFVENFSVLFSLFKTILGWTKWYEKGKQNALDIQVKEETFSFPNLPSAFHNFRILHLSDLHLNHQPELADILLQKIFGLRFDMCLITGDIHHKHSKDFTLTIQLLRKIAPSLKSEFGTWAVLGNHDYIEMVEEIEKIGVQVLLNQTVRIEKDGQALQLVGIDELICRQHEETDKTMFPTSEEFTIYAAHTPELITSAASHSALYLCGHTHGGQICLPNGKPLVLNTSVPLAFCKGKWKLLNLQGYTSTGAGTSGLPVRFHCPPEITIHQLSRTAK